MFTKEEKKKAKRISLLKWDWFRKHPQWIAGVKIVQAKN